MKIEEVRPGIYACLMDNETANAGFVVTGRGVIVIDTLNTPARGRELAAAIRTRTDQPVLFVVNTHHHYDHIFGNQAFDTPIIAHCALAEQLAKAASYELSALAVAAHVSQHPDDRWLADELQLVYPNLVFKQRLVLDLHPVLMVIQHLGGHTPDSSIVDLPDEGVLFAGDLVFEGRVPFLRQAHIESTLQALRRLQGLGERTIVPGHGALCDMTYVARLADYLEALRDSVQELIGRGYDRGDVMEANELPPWWTDDRPDLLRANVGRVYDELMGIGIRG
jgi:cyclase